MSLIRFLKKTFSALSRSRTIFFLSIGFIAGGIAPAKDWVLGSQEFVFRQKGERSSRELKTAKLIPSLILEQTTTHLSHWATVDELLDRDLNSLQTERISLFLQLSKDVQARDSLVLKHNSKSALEKALKEEQKKIQEIQDKIQDNLDRNEKLYEKAYGKEDEKDEENFFQNFASLFREKEERYEESFEKVVLYKSDSSAFYVAPDNLKKSSPSSFEFARAAFQAGLNGLFSGTMAIYGEYVSVTVELNVFPGGKSAGIVTEVGNINDPLTIASNISRKMVGIVSNAKPITLYFDIQNPELVDDPPEISVDGTIINRKDFYANVLAGIHTVEIYKKGYENQTLNYDFSSQSAFLIQVRLKKEILGSVNVTLAKPAFADIFAAGYLVANAGQGIQGGQVQVNGKPVIGLVLLDRGQEQKVSSFFYIPQKEEVLNKDLIVRINEENAKNLIEHRRIMMYRGYSSLMISLPFTFISLGNYNTAAAKVKGGYSRDLNEVNGWRTALVTSGVISGACGAFFIVELVRYLRAADSVLPKNAVPAKEGQVQAILEESNSLVKVQNEVTENSAESDKNDSEAGENPDQHSDENEKNDENGQDGVSDDGYKNIDEKEKTVSGGK